MTTPETEPDVIRVKWERDFPGNSAALRFLRDAVIDAECAERCSSAVFQKIKKQMHESGLSMDEWDTYSLKRFEYFKRQHAFDRRQCVTLVQALQSACTNQKTAEAKAPRVPVPAPEPKPPANKICLEQIIEVQEVDGQVVTSIKGSAAHWCSRNAWHVAGYFVRRFRFQNAVIPEHYRWVLTHDGVTYKTAEDVAIYYSPKEFQHLCELELTSASPHLLDGERMEYQRIEPRKEESHEKN